MLTVFTKYRPKQLFAVYVEPQQVEVLRAHRQWRSWQIDSTERSVVPEGEALFDFLQRLNLRPRSRQGTALILFLPHSYYTLHREHYPGSLRDQLDEALGFDWPENIFHEHERTLHFFGPFVPVNEHLSVPIFSLQKDIYDKFHQVLGAGSFAHFTVIPSALAYKAFLPSPSVIDEESPPIEIFGRAIDSSHLELHRFYKGQLLDSYVIGRDHNHLKLFRESLRCIGDIECRGAEIHLLCTTGESMDHCAGHWKKDLPLKEQLLNDSLVSHWVKYLLGQDQIQTFDDPLLLKPWEIPKVTWFIVCLLALFSFFAFYQIRHHENLQETTKRLKRQSAQLETQWKPIEQLQTRIAKFQEDQKTLSEFNLEGYPVMEILTLLSEVTPTDTWLNYMSLRKGQLMLRGESQSAIKYLSELAKIEGFEDVRFASPVTRNPSSDKERFNVQIQIDAPKLQKTIDTVLAGKLEESTNVDESDGAPPAEIAGEEKPQVMMPADDESGLVPADETSEDMMADEEAEPMLLDDDYEEEMLQETEEGE